MSELHGDMTLEQALSKVKKVPMNVKEILSHPHQHKKGVSHSTLALTAGKSSPTGDVAGALEKAKQTLNNMMEETEAELDEAVLECTEFDKHTVGVLDENTRLRAGLGEEVASARVDIAEATTVINEAKMELESIRIAAEESATQCAAKMAMGKKVESAKFEQPKAILTKTHKKTQ